MKKQLTALLFLTALVLLFTVGAHVAHGHEDMFYHDGCHNCLVSLSLMGVFTIVLVYVSAFLPLTPFSLSYIALPIYSIDDYQYYYPRNRVIFQYYSRPPPIADQS